MPQRPPTDPLQELVTAIIWPPLAERGYERRGSTFRYRFADGAGKLLQVQAAAASRRAGQPFTLALGLYVPLNPAASAPANGPRFQYAECVIGLDISHFRAPAAGPTYCLQPGTEAAVRAAVQADLVQYAVPFLDAYQSQVDILQLLLLRPDLAPFAGRLRVLSGHGYLVEARRQLAQEANRAASPALKELLLNFGQQLGLG